jgi:hypothetical protein
MREKIAQKFPKTTLFTSPPIQRHPHLRKQNPFIERQPFQLT